MYAISAALTSEVGSLLCLREGMFWSGYVLGMPSAARQRIIYEAVQAGSAFSSQPLDLLHKAAPRWSPHTGWLPYHARQGLAISHAHQDEPHSVLDAPNGFLPRMQSFESLSYSYMAPSTMLLQGLRPSEVLRGPVARMLRSECCGTWTCTGWTEPRLPQLRINEVTLQASLP